MSKFRHLIVSTALLAALSTGVFAQKNDDQKKPPPKDPNGPVVVPKEKPPKESPTPKPPKKPGSGYAVIWVKNDNGLA